MSLLKAIAFALAVSSESTCEGGDSVSDVCLLQLKEKQLQEQKQTMETSTRAGWQLNDPQDWKAHCASFQNFTGSMEFACDQQEQCHWVPDSGDNVDVGSCMPCDDPHNNIHPEVSPSCADPADPTRQQPDTYPVACGCGVCAYGQEYSGYTMDLSHGCKNDFELYGTKFHQR